MAHIKEFQNSVWDSENSTDLLSDLALDLDYYEPDESLRKGDPNFYGDERLEEEIKSALQKLKQ